MPKKSRARVTFEPYKTAGPGKIEMNIENSEVEDESLEELIDETGEELDLKEKQDWNELKVKFEVELNFDKRDYVPEQSPPLQLVAVFNKDHTRERFSVPFEKSGHEYELVQKFNQDQCRGPVRVSAHLIRTEDYDGNNGQGYAVNENDQIGHSNQVVIEFDPRVSGPGQFLQVDFTDFSESPNELRKNNADTLYDIQYADMPRILINEGLAPNIESALSTTKKRGPDAVVRDSIYSSIGVGGWLVLAIRSLEDICEDDAEEWQENVINRMMNRVFAEHEVQREQIEEEYENGKWKKVLNKLLLASQKMAKTGESSKKLLKAN